MERSSAVRYTYRDLLSLPEDPARRYEILDGKLYVTAAAPRFNHQRVVRDLGALMQALAQENALGEVVGNVAVHVHDELMFQPDLMFITAGRLDIIDPEGDLHGVPDLAIEILSPSTRSYDSNLKRKLYLDAGVPEVWLVDIDSRTVEVWRREADEPESVDDVLTWRADEATFELPLEEVFRSV